MVLKPYQVRQLVYTTISIFIICLYSCSKDSTLQITSVKLSPDTLYNQTAQRFLGKQLKIVYYDNSVKLFIDGHSPQVLRLYPSGDYLGDSYSLSLFKKYGILDSAILTISEFPKNPPPFEMTVTLIAK